MLMMLMLLMLLVGSLRSPFAQNTFLGETVLNPSFDKFVV